MWLPRTCSVFRLIPVVQIIIKTILCLKKFSGVSNWTDRTSEVIYCLWMKCFSEYSNGFTYFVWLIIQSCVIWGWSSWRSNMIHTTCRLIVLIERTIDWTCNSYCSRKYFCASGRYWRNFRSGIIDDVVIIVIIIIIIMISLFKNSEFLLSFQD